MASQWSLWTKQLNRPSRPRFSFTVLLKFAWAAAQAHGTDPADRQQYEQMGSVIPLVLVRADASDDDPAFVAMP